jgi:hypothetical protein
LFQKTNKQKTKKTRKGNAETETRNGNAERKRGTET